MNFSEFLKNNIVYLDGGMGTLLQAQGLLPGEHPERWNLKHPDIITSIHKSYFDAGSNVVCTNTFGANSIKFKDDELDGIIKAAIENAKATKGKPTAIIAKSVKGKGVSFMENNAGWHGKAPNAEEYAIAMKDLGVE